MKQLIFIAILVVIALGCGQTPGKNNSAGQKPDTSGRAAAIQQQDSISSKPLPYWDTTMSHNSSDGYIDTFSVGETKFRVVDSSYDSITGAGFQGDLQKLTDGQWQRLITMELAMHNNYSRDKDVNGDGYNDLVHAWRYSSDVYFFQPDKKTFDTAIGLELPQVWALLDTARNIYCDNDNVKGIEDNSRLYTFEGLKPVILYTLEFEHEYNEKEDAKMTTKMNLYKGEIGKGSRPIASTPINKVADEYDEDFDYADYWKKNYKELLGYR